jgi:transcriptional regulator with XRE-family HTH domain
MIGYSQNLAKANAQADSNMLGVRLGRLCIKQGISVIEIATRLKISRTAVYNWFTGLNEVSSKYEQEVKKLIDWLKKA